MSRIDDLLEEAAISVELHKMVKEGLLELVEDGSGEVKFKTTQKGWEAWEKATGKTRNK